jgi:hypothetical protein
MNSDPDFVLYVTENQSSSKNLLSLINKGDRVRIQPLFFPIPHENRPIWLRGSPTLAKFTTDSDGVWRGPVYEGMHAIKKMRELCPKGVESLEMALDPDGVQAVVEIEEGDQGQTFIGFDEQAAEDDENGMTQAEGLAVFSDDIQCSLPVNGADSKDDLDKYVQQCIARRQADLPEETDD